MEKQHQQQQQQKTKRQIEETNIEVKEQ